MRIGIFGGSFDPVHVGHLWISEAATEQLELDALHWVPSATQPLKPGGPVASDQHRLDMLRLSIAGRERHFLDDREIRRDGVSYTVDTVKEFKEEFPGAELFLVIGSDSLASMQRWHLPSELLSIVTLSVVQRGGEEEIDFDVLSELVDQSRLTLFRRSTIRMPVIEISSGEIRERVGQGRGIRHRVPRAVEALIGADRVYNADPKETPVMES